MHLLLSFPGQCSLSESKRAVMYMAGAVFEVRGNKRVATHETHLFKTIKEPEDLSNCLMISISLPMFLEHF